MTRFIPHPTNEDGLAKLSGTIRNLKVTRAEGSFVFTEQDQNRMGWIAMAAAFAGLHGQAASTASDASDPEEEADYLEFELDGQPIKGWMWRNPFREGDQVDVAAEPSGDHWAAFGIARPADQTIALYPHCSRGKTTHIRNAFKWWLLLGGGLVFFGYVPILFFGGGAEVVFDFETLLIGGGLMAFFGLMAISTAWKLMPFVRVAQKVFKTLGLPNPERVDLVKRTKQKKTKQDSNQLGVFYFKY